MVKESIVHSQLNTCSSAEGTPVRYAQYTADGLVLFFSWPLNLYMGSFHMHLICCLPSWLSSFHLMFRLYTGTDQRGGITCGFFYPLADCGRRLVPLWVGVVSSWDFLSLCRGSAHCLTWKLLFQKLTTDPVSLGTTVFLSTGMTHLWRVFSVEAFCYVIGIQLS